MTDRELIARRLAGQHLTAPTDALTAAGDLCGIQSQFYPQALHALRLRGGTGETEGLVKSWTLRGTLHLFPERDLPLFLHAGRTPFLRPCDTLAGDEVVSEVRKAYFADCVLERLSAGPALREELKAGCRAAGRGRARKGANWGCSSANARSAPATRRCGRCSARFRTCCRC